MVDEVKPLLTYTRNSGDQREVFETDLNDETKPIVADIQSILNTKASLDEAYQKAVQVVNHYASLNKKLLVEKLDSALPSVVTKSGKVKE
jgi:hypothetical protein